MWHQPDIISSLLELKADLDDYLGNKYSFQQHISGADILLYIYVSINMFLLIFACTLIFHYCLLQPPSSRAKKVFNLSAGLGWSVFSCKKSTEGNIPVKLQSTFQTTTRTEFQWQRIVIPNFHTIKCSDPSPQAPTAPWLTSYLSTKS